MPRRIPEQRLPEGDGILPHRVGHFVEEHLGGIGRMGAADGAPPQHRHTYLRSVQLNREIGDGIRQCRCALDRSFVDTLLYHPRGERRTVEDRLTDNPVLPSDEIALGIEPGLDRVEIHWAIAATANVVHARPDQLHRLTIGAERLRDAPPPPSTMKSEAALARRPKLPPA